jgi:hypothetical protein
MSKIITIRLTQVSPSSGPFSIFDQLGNVIAEDVPRQILINGINYSVSDNVTSVKLKSTGSCKIEKTNQLSNITEQEYINIKVKINITGCIWRHLTNIQLYNSYYGATYPYIIEYPFAYKNQDEILQNVKDYTKAYEYISISDGVFNDNTRIETNNKWFNKAILYNGQQSSGVLNLVAKPLNDMRAYMQYPIFNADSKTITYTKSDNFYQYNTFWALQKSPYIPMFFTSCESLSIDKVINQENMDYSSRSFKKATIRAKELKVRHILKDNCTTHLVSQFLTSPAQISYK